MFVYCFFPFSSFVFVVGVVVADIIDVNDNGDNVFNGVIVDFGVNNVGNVDLDIHVVNVELDGNLVGNVDFDLVVIDDNDNFDLNDGYVIGIDDFNNNDDCCFSVGIDDLNSNNDCLCNDDVGNGNGDDDDDDCCRRIVSIRFLIDIGDDKNIFLYNSNGIKL